MDGVYGLCRLVFEYGFFFVNCLGVCDGALLLAAGFVSLFSPSAWAKALFRLDCPKVTVLDGVDDGVFEWLGYSDMLVDRAAWTFRLRCGCGG